MPVPNINGGRLPAATVTAVAPPRDLGSFGRGMTFSNGNYGSIMSSIVGSFITGLQNAFNRAWQSEQAKVAYDRQVEQWRRENAYNTPAAMVARLRAAGINVNDAFSGQGAQPAGGLSSVSPASYNPMSIVGSVSSLIGSRADLMNASTSRSRAVAQNALDLEQVERLKNLIHNTNIDSAYKSVLLKYVDRSESLRLDNISAQVALTNSQRSYIDERVRYYSSEIKSLIENRQADTARLNKLLFSLEQDIQTSKSLQGLYDKQIEYVKAVAISNAITGGIRDVLSGSFGAYEAVHGHTVRRM